MVQKNKKTSSEVGNRTTSNHTLQRWYAEEQHIKPVSGFATPAED